MLAAEQEDLEVTIRQDTGPTEPEHVQDKGLDATPDDITLPPSDDSLPRAQEDESELLPSKDDLVKTVMTKIQVWASYYINLESHPPFLHIVKMYIKTTLLSSFSFHICIQYLNETLTMYSFSIRHRHFRVFQLLKRK